MAGKRSLPGGGSRIFFLSSRRGFGVPDRQRIFVFRLAAALCFADPDPVGCTVAVAREASAEYFKQRKA